MMYLGGVQLKISGEGKVGDVSGGVQLEVSGEVKLGG